MAIKIIKNSPDYSGMDSSKFDPNTDAPYAAPAPAPAPAPRSQSNKFTPQGYARDWNQFSGPVSRADWQPANPYANNPYAENI